MVGRGLLQAVQGVRGALGPCAAIVASATLWSVHRDLRRARNAVRLDPPATHIQGDVVPPARDGSVAGDDGAAASARRRPIRLVTLGDSSVAGIGVDRVTDCLAVQIARRVANVTGEAVQVRSLGVSGARTADVAATQVPALELQAPPDVVVVVVGANDIMHVTPPWRYARTVAGLYGALRERVAVPVVACSLPEIRAITIVGRPLRDAAVAYGRLLGVVQRRVIEQVPGVTFVDARSAAGPAFLRDPRAMAVDGFHPSAVGYSLLADVLAPAVCAALGPRN